MDPTTLASLLKEYGPWGLLAITMLAVVYLFRALTTCQEGRILDAKELGTALAEAKLTNATLISAFQSRTGAFERLGEQVERGVGSIEGNQRIILAGLSENQRALEELRRGRL